MNEDYFFEEALVASRSLGLKLSVVYVKPHGTKLRLAISDGTFIEAFHSQKTGRFSFALIKAGRRIYGADNKDGWHEHPFGEEEKHVGCEPISIGKFSQKAVSKVMAQPTK